MKIIKILMLLIFSIASYANTDYDFIGSELVSNKDYYDINKLKINCLVRSEQDSSQCERIQFVQSNEAKNGEITFHVIGREYDVEELKKLKKLMIKAVRQDSEIFIANLTFLSISGALEYPFLIFFLPIAIPIDIVTLPISAVDFINRKISTRSRIKLNKFFNSVFNGERKSLKINFEAYDSIRGAL